MIVHLICAWSGRGIYNLFGLRSWYRDAFEVILMVFIGSGSWSFYFEQVFSSSTPEFYFITRFIFVGILISSRTRPSRSTSIVSWGLPDFSSWLRPLLDCIVWTWPWCQISFTILISFFAYRATFQVCCVLYSYFILSWPRFLVEGEMGFDLAAKSVLRACWKWPALAILSWSWTRLLLF